MLTVKKISAIEFRLHNREFYCEYSPTNYIDRLRLEIFLQNFIYWFYEKYGIYLYLQQVRVDSVKILFQCYFYATVRRARFEYSYFGSKVAGRGISVNLEHIGNRVLQRIFKKS